MPRAPKFTDAHIKVEAVPGQRLFVRDTPGLYLFTSPGAKANQRWLHRYTNPETKRVTERSLGRYPEVTLEMARNRIYHSNLIMRRDRIDPYKMAAADTATITFKEVVDDWFKDREGKWFNEKQRKDAENRLLVHAKPLHDKPLLRIKPDDIFNALKDKWPNTPDQVHRVTLKISEMFEFARVKEKYLGRNPAKWKGNLSRLFPPLPNGEANHFAAMPYEEVPQFVKALRERQGRSVAALALEFTILTCVRTKEALGIKWDEINWDAKQWNVPARRMKMKVSPHVVPLSDRALEILKRRREQHRGGEYVFSGYKANQPMAENGMRQVLWSMKVPFTVHGFRTSFFDWGGDETDFAEETMDLSLAHKQKSKTRRAYRRRTALEKRREVMEAWAAYCG